LIAFFYLRRECERLTSGLSRAMDERFVAEDFHHGIPIYQTLLEFVISFGKFFHSNYFSLGRNLEFTSTQLQLKYYNVCHNVMDLFRLWVRFLQKLIDAPNRYVFRHLVNQCTRELELLNQKLTTIGECIVLDAFNTLTSKDLLDVLALDGFPPEILLFVKANPWVTGSHIISCTLIEGKMRELAELMKSNDPGYIGVKFNFSELRNLFHPAALRHKHRKIFTTELMGHLNLTKMNVLSLMRLLVHADEDDVDDNDSSSSEIDGGSGASSEANFQITVTEAVIGNDAENGPDLMKWQPLTSALSKAVAETETPFVVGVYGQWGSGKSFLVNKVRS